MKKDIVSRITVSRKHDTEEYQRQYRKLYYEEYKETRVRSEQELKYQRIYAREYYRNHPEKKRKWTPEDSARQRQLRRRIKCNIVRRQAIEDGFTPEEALQAAALYDEAKTTWGDIRKNRFHSHPELRQKLINFFGSLGRFDRVCKSKIKSESRKRLIASSKTSNQDVAEHQ